MLRGAAQPEAAKLFLAASLTDTYSSPPPPLCSPSSLCLQVAALDPSDPLPEDLMQRFYHDAYALLRSGRYADRIAPFLEHFKREK